MRISRSEDIPIVKEKIERAAKRARDEQNDWGQNMTNTKLECSDNFGNSIELRVIFPFLKSISCRLTRTNKLIINI